MICLTKIKVISQEINEKETINASLAKSESLEMAKLTQ
jgi:hypothetical protein